MARSTGSDLEAANQGLALVRLPARSSTPFNELAWRILLAFTLLAISTLIVWLDRDSYIDNVNGDSISFVDAIYYSTVTVTTTGYGDITPQAPHARLLNALVVTPLRIGFLVLLVGTTLEVLANQGKRAFLDAGWRKRMRNHTVVIGYGTMGRSAVATLRRQGTPVEKIVIIDRRPTSVSDANTAQLAAFEGDATRREVLRGAEISKAREVIITLDRDDTAILSTLTVRQLNPVAHVVVAVREQENVPLLRQSGANAVVTSSDAVGRLMGLSTISPHVGLMIEDLLSNGEGVEVAQRQVRPEEVGKAPWEIRDERVIGIVRNQTLRRFYEPSVEHLETGDELVCIRRSASDPTTKTISRSAD